MAISLYPASKTIGILEDLEQLASFRINKSKRNTEFSPSIMSRLGNPIFFTCNLKIVV
jgi:hypothetical protein